MAHLKLNFLLQYQKSMAIFDITPMPEFPEEALENTNALLAHIADEAPEGLTPRSLGLIEALDDAQKEAFENEFLDKIGSENLIWSEIQIACSPYPLGRKIRSCCYRDQPNLLSLYEDAGHDLGTLSDCSAALDGDSVVCLALMLSGKNGQTAHLNDDMCYEAIDLGHDGVVKFLIDVDMMLIDRQVPRTTPQNSECMLLLLKCGYLIATPDFLEDAEMAGNQDLINCLREELGL